MLVAEMDGEGRITSRYLSLSEGTRAMPIAKLRDADGSIIRNNRFIVKRSGLFRKKEEVPQAGINLLESRDVLIEGNVFEQVDLPLRKDEASTVREQGGTAQAPEGR